MTAGAAGPAATGALRLIVLLGVVSLFADMTYEGARSVTGPFLAVLGASGTAVGLVAGAGELVGYAVRLLSGYLSDRTRAYWPFTLAGYAVNVLAVPAMALAGCWEVVGALMIAERLGKAIRTPARDAMLSHATSRVGAGWGFGLHEAMDQVGAVVGPLLVAGVLVVRPDYRAGFAALVVPALLCLLVLGIARAVFPEPRHLEVEAETPAPAALSPAFWRYLIAAGCIAAGYVDFPLIAYHVAKTGLAPERWIPLAYAVAMAADGLAALAFGRLFDRLGIPVLAGATILAAGFPLLAFGQSVPAALVGILLWGIGMGAQESILRGAIATMVPADRRASAYGVFNAGYGLAWFAGSALMGLLYDVSLAGMVVLSTILQLAAVPLLLARTRGGPHLFGRAGAATP